MTINDPSTGESSYYYTGKPLQNGWTLVTTVSTKQFRKGIMASVLQMGLVIGLALILALFITMVAVRKLIGPAKLLLNSMSAFGNGNLDSRVKFSRMMRSVR